MRYEWDARKAAANRSKHGVSFEEAASVFRDPLSQTGDDPDHSLAESRFITFGVSARGRLLVVAHAEQGDTIRIISARQRGDELRSEYKRSDFGRLARGKYAHRSAGHSNVVVLEPQVARAFPNDRAVNQALRALLRLRKAKAARSRRARRT